MVTLLQNTFWLEVEFLRRVVTPDPALPTSYLCTLVKFLNFFCPSVSLCTETENEGSTIKSANHRPCLEWWLTLRVFQLWSLFPVRHISSSFLPLCWAHHLWNTGHFGIFMLLHSILLTSKSCPYLFASHSASPSSKVIIFFKYLKKMMHHVQEEHSTYTSIKKILIALNCTFDISPVVEF